jgi:hypothetical protein
MTFTLQPVRVATGFDEEGMMLLDERQRLVAVLVRLSDENEVAPGQWYLEAGFGRLKDSDQENQTISRREIVIKKPAACPIVSA